MLKLFCDRCGKELKKDRNVGNVIQENGCVEYSESYRLKKIHLCWKCDADFYKFLKNLPVESQKP